MESKNTRIITEHRGVQYDRVSNRLSRCSDKRLQHLSPYNMPMHLIICSEYATLNTIQYWHFVLILGIHFRCFSYIKMISLTQLNSI